MLRTGVVGLGMMGQHHVRVYKELGCNVTGIADASPERAREIGEKYDVPYYTDYHSLLGEVDAVSIAVPTTLHRSVAMDFIENGVHCLIEKPIASTMEEAEDIVNAAEKNGVKVLIGHIERFNPAILKLKDLLNAGRLGKLMDHFHPPRWTVPAAHKGRRHNHRYRHTRYRCRPFPYRQRTHSRLL
jgi:UDP-N-acetylglucosamine 3-dehydrogenase